MKLFLPVVLIPFSTAIADSATQTNWSGGPGIAGPVENWGDFFSSSYGAGYTYPGVLRIEPMVLEFPVAADHTLEGAWNVCTPDINGDGHIDVLACSVDGGIYWWENPFGPGSWIMHGVVGVVAKVMGICPGDLDGDGDLDVVSALPNLWLLSWWENEDGTGLSWGYHIVDINLNTPEFVQITDIDTDGDADILVCLNLGTLWYENSSGFGSVWIEHSVSAHSCDCSTYAVDIDGDGDMDIVGANYSTDKVYWWDNVDHHGKVWSEHTIASGFEGVDWVFPGDIDGDLDVDLVGSAYFDNEIAWWENTDGSGLLWTEHVIAGSYTKPVCVGLWDLDHDGDLDVLATSEALGSFAWWKNEGEGDAWSFRGIDPTINWPSRDCAADFDEDGNLDVLGISRWIGWISWWDIGDRISWLESSILDAGEQADWGSLSWACYTPPGTEVSFQVRAGNNPLDMGEWSDTLSAPGSLHGILADDTRYIQYKALLSTESNSFLGGGGILTPGLYDVTIGWNPLEIGSGDTFPALALSPVMPNPCAGSPNIEFGLPSSIAVEIAIFDISGRLVQDAGPSEYEPGNHTIQLQPLSPGIYFVRMQAGEFTATQRFVVVE